MKLYTKKEDDYIMFWFGEKNTNQMALALNRTAISIQSRIRKLDIKLYNRKLFTPEEDKYIIKNYQNKSMGEMGRELNRHKTVIRNRIIHLNLEYKKYDMKYWSKEQIELVKKMIEDYATLNEIADAVNKTERAVTAKIRTLKITIKNRRNGHPNKWTEEELNFLKNNINTMSPTNIGKQIGRTYPSIKKMIKKLGLKTKIRSNGYKHWSKEEINTLYQTAGTMCVKELTKLLPNRSYGSISNKIYELDIPWTQGTITIKEIANILNVSRPCVIRHLKQKKYFRKTKYNITPDVIPFIAQSILNNNISLGKCGASIKHLETIAKGEFETTFSKETEFKCEIPLSNCSSLAMFQDV